MTTSTFDRPVTVFVGLGFPLEIKETAAAHAFLSDWPSSKRDAAHGIALNECRAALAGEADAASARAAFATFAKRHCILCKDDLDMVAARSKSVLSSRPAA